MCFDRLQQSCFVEITPCLALTLLVLDKYGYMDNDAKEGYPEIYSTADLVREWFYSERKTEVLYAEKCDLYKNGMCFNANKINTADYIKKLDSAMEIIKWITTNDIESELSWCYRSNLDHFADDCINDFNSLQSKLYNPLKKGFIELKNIGCLARLCKLYHDIKHKKV